MKRKRSLQHLDVRNCTRCGELRSVDDFYFVSKKTGVRRGQCKDCMREVKREQRDPDWTPTCANCLGPRARVGTGRRLCDECFSAIYDSEAKRDNGSHRLRLKDCPSCGAKRLRADHMHGSSLCPRCRSVSSGRRTQLRTRYNLNPREYLDLLAHQNEVCGICQKRKKTTLHIDHQHAEPRHIRGAICNTCNTMIGLARDDVEVLLRAAKYLINPPAQQIMPERAANLAANRSYNWLRRS